MSEAHYLQPDLDDDVPVDDEAEPEDANVGHFIAPLGLEYDDGS
jgi:hypothetical protein